MPPWPTMRVRPGARCLVEHALLTTGAYEEAGLLIIENSSKPLVKDWIGLFVFRFACERDQIGL